MAAVLASASMHCLELAGAETSAALASKLKTDYLVTRVGSVGFKFDYDHIVQPGTLFTVRIPGIYADPANTPQAIVNTVIVNGEAQQKRSLLSALSSTTQGRTFSPGEQVYATRVDVRQDGVHFELLSAGTALPRYRAEVKFVIPNMSTQESSAVEQTIGASLSSGARHTETLAASTEAADSPAQVAARPAPSRSSPSRPGVAVISPQQQQKIATQISRAPAALSKQAAEAADTLKEFIALNSCINDYTAKSQLQTYLGPHGNLNAINPPFGNMRFHDKGTCLDVTRIQGWNTLSLNAFEFQVVYTAADSGESTVRTHQTQREPDGTWLMNE